ncbi:MAG: sugar porter family MFS transporter [Acidobacteria bacterium]|jgi:sugar porter (SP) family MFS transporter|nr:sugar porter family MFS transporter [Acidobacteriota bacterium]
MSDVPAAPVSARDGRRRIVVITLVAALGGFLFGYDTAVINGAVVAIREEFGVSSGLLGFTVSSALLGSALGAWYAGPLADRISRVRAMRLAAVLFLVSALGSGLAGSIGVLILWRVIGGIGVGVASVVVPAYIAELAPADLRGRLGSLQQLAIVTGIFLALLANFAIAEAAGGASAEWWLGEQAWRWMFWSEAIPAVVYGVGTLLIPRSPRFLVMKGRDAEAERVLAAIGHADPAAKVAEIRATMAAAQPRLPDLRGPVLGLLPIVWVGIGLSALQQLVGINVIFYYSSTLWQAVGFSESDALLITVITSVINVLTTIVAIATVDRLGRKPLLLIGSVGMTVSLGVMALVFGVAGETVAGEPDLGSVGGPVALVAANLFVIFFGMSWGPVVWVLLGEMFPNRIRAIALSVAVAVQWVTNFLVSTTFPPLSDAGLGFAYGIYAFFSFVSIFFVARLVQETKGRELEEMSDGTAG